MRIPQDRYSLHKRYSVDWRCPEPCFTFYLIPTYSIHVDRGVHAIFPGMAAATFDDTDPLRGNHGYSLGQKALVFPHHFFFFLENLGLTPL
jgi:hypothetical protein